MKKTIKFLVTHIKAETWYVWQCFNLWTCATHNMMPYELQYMGNCFEDDYDFNVANPDNMKFIPV